MTLNLTPHFIRAIILSCPAAQATLYSANPQCEKYFIITTTFKRTFSMLPKDEEIGSEILNHLSKSTGAIKDL